MSAGPANVHLHPSLVPIIHWRTIYVPASLVALAGLIVILVITGALYAGGAIRGRTYALLAINCAFALLLLTAVAAGRFIYLRWTHP
jgi:hypothetical protein